MNIAILGYAAQGQSNYKYFNKGDNQITICDANPDIELPQSVKSQLGDDYLKNLDRFDVILRTSSLHPKKILDANPEAPDILNKVSSSTEEFFKACPSRNIIGVTGTKGKGTTSTLIAKILQEAGKTVHLGGNIGLPPLEMLHGKGSLDDATTTHKRVGLGSFRAGELSDNRFEAIAKNRCLLDGRTRTPRLAHRYGRIRTR
jgi:UDP-N-acetylmuramoylalanine--D-glutamate ligase